jgi:hypothetical protein
VQHVSFACLFAFLLSVCGLLHPFWFLAAAAARLHGMSASTSRETPPDMDIIKRAKIRVSIY